MTFNTMRSEFDLSSPRPKINKIEAPTPNNLPKGPNADERRYLSFDADAYVMKTVPISNLKRQDHDSGKCPSDYMESDQYVTKTIPIGDIQNEERKSVPPFVESGAAYVMITIPISNLETKVLPLAPSGTVEKGASFACFLCTYVTKNCDNFKRHQLGAHGRDHVCPQCNKSFSTDQFLQAHKRKAHEGCKFAFVCSLCDYQTNKNSRLKRHGRVHRTEGRNHVCPHCNKTFATDLFLEGHKRKVHEGCKFAFACPSCKYQTNNLSHLTRHNRVHATEGREHLCTAADCKKTFSSEHLLQSHKRKVHEGLKFAFVCSSCKYQTNHLSHLKKHDRVHSTEGRGHLCPLCNKTFTSEHILRAHTRRIHEGRKLAFACSSCDYETNMSGHLNRHCRLVHLHRTAPTRHLMCGQCDKTFTNNFRLQAHTRTVHEGRQFPHACNICCYVSKKCSYLKRHIRCVHRGKTASSATDKGTEEKRRAELSLSTL